MNKLLARLATVTYRTARRIVIAVIGATVLLAGIAMIVLPGPAILVIPLGLAILGIEFAWARHWLKKVKAAAADGVNFVTGRRNQTPRT